MAFGGGPNMKYGGGCGGIKLINIDEFINAGDIFF